MEFRVDFFFRVVMDTAFYAVHLAFFAILYNHTGTIAGWTIDQAFVFASGMFFVDAVFMTVFANNMWWLPILINRGDLDYYLVRPVSSLFFLSTRDFAANSFLNLIIASGILAWAVFRYDPNLPLFHLSVFVAMLVCGAILTWVFHLLFLIPVFWLHAENGLRQLCYSFEKFGERPDGIYKPWLRRILTTWLPFALVASFPARLLFDGPTLASAGYIVGVTAIAFLVAAGAWRLGLRAYSSASS